MKKWNRWIGLMAVLCMAAALFACAKADADVVEQAPKAAQQRAEPVRSTADMVEAVTESVVGIANLQSGQQGLGSGVIVTENGYILTNHHVASAGDEVTLIFKDGTKRQAQAVWSDRALDLAVLKAEGTFRAARMGSAAQVRAGEEILVIGTPLALQFQHTVTGGIVSALDRTLQVPSGNSLAFMEQLIQTDAAINPGNSGGPMLNEAGEVIGIITMRVEEAAGMGFAIPIDLAKPIVAHFEEDGAYTTPHLGAYLYDREIAMYYDAQAEMEEGLFVAEVEAESAAQEAGLQRGDIILRADGSPCDSLTDLRYAILSHKAGEEMQLLLRRNGQEKTVTAVLKPR